MVTPATQSAVLPRSTGPARSLSSRTGCPETSAWWQMVSGTRLSWREIKKDIPGAPKNIHACKVTLSNTNFIVLLYDWKLTYIYVSVTNLHHSHRPGTGTAKCSQCQQRSRDRREWTLRGCPTPHALCHYRRLLSRCPESSTASWADVIASRSVSLRPSYFTHNQKSIPRQTLHLSWLLSDAYIGCIIEYETIAQKLKH